MGRKYKCCKCGKTHERPVGQDCEYSGNPSTSMGDNETGGGAEKSGETSGSNLAGVTEVLKAISQRLDMLEKDRQKSSAASGPTHGDESVLVTGMTASEGDPLLAAGKSLDQLLQLNPSNKHCASKDSVDRDKYDPRTMLTVKAKQVKTVHITQFLHEGTRKRRAQLHKRDIILDASDGQHERLIIRADDQHPYANIMVAEWGAANCRLMHHLIQSGQLKVADIDYYLAYTAKIFDLVDKYDWNSVLDYDYQYRELQAEHGFNWGTANPYLELQVLTPRRQTPAFESGRTRANKNTVAEDCKLFLAHGHCRFGDQCRYRHRTRTQAKADTPPPPKSGQ